MWTGIPNFQQMICIFKAINDHLLVNKYTDCSFMKLLRKQSQIRHILS